MTEIHITVTETEGGWMEVKTEGKGTLAKHGEVEAAREIIDAVNAFVNRHPHQTITPKQETYVPLPKQRQADN